MADTAGSSERLEANKKLVLEFYDAIIRKKDFEAGRKYMGTTYRQHAPYAADGPEGLRAFVTWFRDNCPNHRFEIKRVIAEGDFVMLHSHGISGLNPNGEAVVDIFRVEDGQVVEHWDIIQAIPEKIDNPNGMF